MPSPDSIQGWSLLRPYQQRAALALAAGPYVGLWFSAGVGKTAAALAAWKLLPGPGDPALVVTRAIGRHVWGRDAAWVLGAAHPAAVLWGGKPYSQSGRHRDGTYSSLGEALRDAQLVVTNYEVLGRRIEELRQVPWRHLVYDEAHAVKQGWQPPRRLASTRAVKPRRFEHAVELARLVQARGGRVWELTATPVADRVRDLWGQLWIALPQETKRFYPPFGSTEQTWPETSWGGRYCGLTRGYNDALDSRGSTHLDELSAYLHTRFLVETRATVAHELPPITRDVIPVERRRESAHLGGGIESALARAAEAKLPEAVELALGYLGSGEHVVLVTNRLRTNGLLAAELEKAARHGITAARRRQLWLRAVTGEVEIRERVRITREFQSWAGPAALVATIDSITEAIDLQSAAGLVFVALPYTPRQVEQCEGRVGRLGGVPCTIHYLVAEDTVDEQIRLLILSKLDAVDASGAGTGAGTGASGALRGMRDEAEVLAELNAWLVQGDERREGEDHGDPEDQGEAHAQA